MTLNNISIAVKQ